MARLVGGILQGVGILVATVSGLCTLGFLASFLFTPPGEDYVLGLVLMIGGIPFLVSICLIHIGRALVRCDSD
jgi:hypothetical protein